MASNKKTQNPTKKKKTQHKIQNTNTKQKRETEGKVRIGWEDDGD